MIYSIKCFAYGDKTSNGIIILIALQYLTY